MSDWMDFLEGLSGATGGFVTGLTAGAKPFDAWEGVRTKDIANDRGEINNRDLYLTQDARENAGYDYYGNKIGAEDTGYRQKMASGELDIFGNQQKLALADYLADPNGPFQQGLRETGWTPGSPEYREWLAEAMAQFDPSGAVGAYDKFNIPGLENRNLNEQASLAFIEAYARQKDPDARVVRNSDGTVSILGREGETPVPGDLLVKVASMLNAKDPYAAISQGLKDEQGIQNTNINLIKALKDGQITPAAAVKLIDNQRIGLNQAINQARNEYNTIIKSQEYNLATPEEKAAMVEDVRQRVTQLQRQQAQNQQMYNQLVLNNAVPRVGGTGSPAPRSTPGPGASVTTRPRPGGMAARAAGVLEVPWGQSSAGPAYPSRRTSPQDTGVRSITQGSGDDLTEFLRALGVL